MGHSLQMNTLRTGQTEVGGSNESGQTDSRGESSEGGETDDEYKSDALTLKATQMMSLLLLSPQTRNICRRAASYNTLRTSSNKKSRK